MEGRRGDEGGRVNHQISCSPHETRLLQVDHVTPLSYKSVISHRLSRLDFSVSLIRPSFTFCQKRKLRPPSKQGLLQHPNVIAFGFRQF